MPAHASVMTQAPAPAASNTRDGGENPTLAIDCRLMFSTIRAEQLMRLWSQLTTWPIQGMLPGNGRLAHLSPASRNDSAGARSATAEHNCSPRCGLAGEAAA